jgi:hypothetical protein
MDAKAVAVVLTDCTVIDPVSPPTVTEVTEPDPEPITAVPTTIICLDKDGVPRSADENV